MNIINVFGLVLYVFILHSYGKKHFTKGPCPKRGIKIKVV